MDESQALSWLLSGVLVLIVVALSFRTRGTMSPAEFDVIASICDTVVLAVEQSAFGQPGPVKKRLAHETSVKVFTRLGIHVPESLVDAFIEASVLLLNRLKGDAAQ